METNTAILNMQMNSFAGPIVLATGSLQVSWQMCSVLIHVLR